MASLHIRPCLLIQNRTFVQCVCEDVNFEVAKNEESETLTDAVVVMTEFESAVAMAFECAIHVDARAIDADVGMTLTLVQIDAAIPLSI